MKLAIVLTEGFADWECALLMASGRSHYGFEIVTASPGGKPVMSMGGLKVSPDRPVETLEAGAFDCLVLCGGETWENSETAPDLSPLLRSFHEHGRVVGGICAATLALAGAGLLNTVSHTSNERDFLKTTPAYTGASHYRSVPYAVRDGQIVTAPGTAPVTFAAEIYRALGLASRELDHYVRLFGAEHIRMQNHSTDGMASA